MAELHERPRLQPTGEFRLRCHLYEKTLVNTRAGHATTVFKELPRAVMGYKRTLLTKEQHQLSGQAEQHSIAEIGIKWSGYDVKPGWRVEIRYRGSRPSELYHIQTVEDYDGRGRVMRLRVSPAEPQ